MKSTSLESAQRSGYLRNLEATQLAVGEERTRDSSSHRSGTVIEAEHPLRPMNARRLFGLRGAAARVALVVVGVVGAWSRDARAEDANSGGEGVEHTIIVGVGGAGELELGDRSLYPGVNVMVEWDAIENWLELEVGASLLTADHGVEVPIDLLAKKPFRLARWAEFMVGVGPEVVQVTGPNRGTFFGGELALDFMFWPWGRRVGLWVEPEYDLVFHGGAASGIGATGGVLFGW